MPGAILKRLVKRAAWLVAVGALTLLALRVYDSQRGPPLESWHTVVPRELTADEIAGIDWQGYLEAEETVLEEVRARVTRRLDTEERVPANRYFEDSPVYPGRFSHDWNRSQVLEPDGAPAGAVVLLHGLTDSPYSMRQVARSYRDHGFVAIVPRLPGHGTVPAGLSKVHWEDWAAATHLAVREAVRRAGPGRPLHLVGYSNGGALALKYALDAVEDPGLPRPARVVLVSPMIGITEMARFAGFAGLPAIFPPFAKAAWLAIVPEFNPFKYNSFPVNGARQSSLLTRALQPRVARLARDGRLVDFPPVLTFQSATDFTVSTEAIVSALYDHLPANGSELVIYDLNRHTQFGPLLRAGKETLVERLLPDAPRRYRTTVLSNAGTGSALVAERITEPGALAETTRPLALGYPDDIFSLSHIALPFPEDDPLYGVRPDPAEDFGVQLGAMAKRGERGTLIVSLDALGRTSWNPFFPYQMRRIEEGIGSGLR